MPENSKVVCTAKEDVFNWKRRPTYYLRMTTLIENSHMHRVS